MVHGFESFGGVTATVLTDNMKTVVLERVDDPVHQVQLLAGAELRLAGGAEPAGAAVVR
jgi:hypothetical protein